MNIADHIDLLNAADLNRSISITADEESVGAGSAPTRYTLSWTPQGEIAPQSITLEFHTGNPAEVGCRGITNEALIGVLTHRLSCFQKGVGYCAENSHVINLLSAAKFILNKRSRERMARGVHGKPVV